jgi:mRNA-degrading endonuclease RelE of RelBE toxin-antitoxin system
MAFRVTITDVAEEQLRALPIHERRTLKSAILARLRDQPTTLSKSIKRLQPNPVAEFELRSGDLRVLYNVGRPPGAR